MVGTLVQIFDAAAGSIPGRLDDWDERVSTWLESYERATTRSAFIEVVLGTAAFVFDSMQERVALAYAVSTPKLQARDAARMRGFPDVNIGVRRVLGPTVELYDRGHYLGHASGGELDMNLFPHKRALNRGWSAEGKQFRRLERFVAAHPGIFFFHRPAYVDDTWIPSVLTYGALVDGDRWEEESFNNR